MSLSTGVDRRQIMPSDKLCLTLIVNANQQRFACVVLERASLTTETLRVMAKQKLRVKATRFFTSGEM